MRLFLLLMMNHFAPSGIKGLDLYCLKNKKWQFVNSARPAGKSTSIIIIDHMQESDMEYMLYLPLYDGLANLEIGVKLTTEIGNPLLDSPRKDKPEATVDGVHLTDLGFLRMSQNLYPVIRKLINKNKS